MGKRAGETLAGLPGIHLDNFGGGASRPVIRGQTLLRIELLTDGANLFDVSSVSPDHAITTDPLLLDAIEIQRGPSAIRFGVNATNGAINLTEHCRSGDDPTKPALMQAEQMLASLPA